MHGVPGTELRKKKKKSREGKVKGRVPYGRVERKGGSMGKQGLRGSFFAS